MNIGDVIQFQYVRAGHPPILRVGRINHKFGNDRCTFYMVACSDGHIRAFRDCQIVNPKKVGIVMRAILNICGVRFDYEI